MIPAVDPCEAILERYVRGEISGAVTLMEMLIVLESLARVTMFVHRAAQSLGRLADGLEGGVALARITKLVRLLEQNVDGCAQIAEMLRSNVDSARPAPSVGEGIAFCKRLFDWSVQQNEEASVALYSLGNPELLASATDEIARVFEEWQLLGTDRAALQIGCGIGRFEAAFAPRLSEAHGIDVSPKMIEAARRRCAGLANVHLATCSGEDLADLPAQRFDLVYAVDTFPYLVQSGMALVRTHFLDAARVLKDGGDFVVLNFSYREDEGADRRDVRALGREAGFVIVVDGTTPFTLWNGRAFHLKKRGA